MTFKQTTLKYKNVSSMISNITSDLKKKGISIKSVINEGFICLSYKKTDILIKFVINSLYK